MTAARPAQEAVLMKLRLWGETGDHDWYVPETRSEAIALGQAAKRGLIEKGRIGRRAVYRLATPELTTAVRT